MAIKSSEYFVFDGKKSSDFGILNVNVSQGLLEEQFLPSSEISETYIRGRNKPYYHDKKLNPLVLNLTFFIEDYWDEERIREIARWLSVDYYKELYFSDNINRIFYAMPVDEMTLIHNALSQGYINLTMRCNSPYSYSPIYLSQVYDFSINPTYQTIQIINSGDIVCKPEIWIYKVGAGDVSIYNLSDGNKEFKFTGLSDTEEVYVDCENEYIESSLGVSRYDNFNDGYISLPRGSNILKVVGNVKVRFRYQFRTLNG